ncbi:DUF3267 domain-containing protein [Chryseobacterium sp. RLHN22]|uniref:DUF3267 domain-containing protein n=1 Tax=Chryseobacterium sp. RLHN22 TaxID=3437885 RepID=UPI003D9B9F42
MNFEDYCKEEKIIDLAKANGISLLYLLVFAVVFSVPYYFIWGFNISLKSIGENISFAFLPLIVIILGIIIHELIHGIFFAIYASKGFKSIKFGILWKMITPYCHCKEPLKIKNYIVALLAPFILLGIIPAIISLAIGNIALLAFGIFFSSAAAGDLLIYSLIKKENPEDYVQDHPSEAGYYIFRKEY